MTDMNDTHDVISAFLDDEPFDAGELSAALSDPAGRALLLDLVALRHVVQPTALVAPSVPERRRQWRRLLAAAAMIVALAGGYFIGERRHAVETAEPPAPSRVVQANDWHALPAGGGQ
jgi:hypothetical protein